jgi:hypothetical protein
VVEWKWTTHPLFNREIDWDDPIQRQGGCGMVAGLSGMAQSPPLRKAITEAIRDNGDGTYTVRFFEVPGAPRPPKEHLVQVDGRLPHVNGRPIYGNTRDGGSSWVGLLEKAYAQWRGGDYNQLAGPATEIFKALTGRIGAVWDLPNSADSQFQLLRRSLDAGEAVTAAPSQFDDFRYQGTNIFTMHQYTVVDCFERDGGRFVKLRNPWGRVEPEGDGKDDGVFDLPLATFGRLFMKVYTSGQAAMSR